MKVVINACYGGFGLSYEGMMLLAQKKGITLYAFTEGRKPNGHLDFENMVPYNGGKKEKNWVCAHYSTEPLCEGKIKNDAYFSDYNLKRDDPDLVAVVEELGEKSFGQCANLRVVEVPSGVDWHISEHDGFESVDENHRSWN